MSQSSDNHSFLFASLDSKAPSTTRKVHIRRLYDILQLCLQRNDFRRAQRAWAILVRCKEIHWTTMWTTGVQILGNDIDGDDTNSQRFEYLRSMKLHNPDEVS